MPVAALGAFGVALAVVALNEHAPLGVTAGPLARLLGLTAPLVAAVVAALAVAVPWRGFLLVLLLTPYWDAAQVSWQAGPLQVILQTVFVGALAAGCALESRGGRLRSKGQPFGGDLRWPLVAIVALVVVGSLSTLASPDRLRSLNVLLHGIVEPVAVGIFLVVLGRTRRRLAEGLAVVAVSVAIGGLLNLAQSLPSASSLAVLQADRGLFARLTYFNVGLFGEVLAMAVPLLFGILAVRSRRLGKVAISLVIGALVVCGACLLLTFSKSAWLASVGAIVILAILLARTWRRRASILLAAVALSAAVIPWPVLVLRPISPALAGTYQSAMVGLMGQSRFDSWNPTTLAGRNSFGERLYATEAAVAMTADHPLLGIGLDQFQTQYRATKPASARQVLDSAHSFWPEIGAELGLPALLIVILLFSMALLAAWRTYRAPPDEPARRLAATLLAGLVAWLIVATAFAGDLYRPWRNMASDFVMVAVIVAAAFALRRLAAVQARQ
ncbi:MAG: O-antigen ligase family protein [Candidatus Limnocylindrales bacterium]